MQSELFTFLPVQCLTQMAEFAFNTPKGAFCEVGVYRGGSAYALYLVAQEQGRDLFLFDTFTGIPERTPALDHHAVGDFHDGTLEAVKTKMPEAKVCVGIFPQTIPSDLGPVSFVHADADQYVSTKAVIEELGARMVPGGVMVFDDMDHLGVKKAIAECLAGKEVVDIGWNRGMVRF